MKEKKSPSPFAAALRSLLEDTNRFDRAGWCQFLDVSSPAVSQWLSDDTVPRPEVLRMIVDELERTSNSAAVNSAPLTSFRELCDLPAQVASSLNGARMGPTVGHYLVGPLRESFLEMLATLPSADQELVLREAHALVTRAMAEGPDFWRLSQYRDLVERYPAGTVIRAHHLVDFFGNRRWSSITVVGRDPVELATLPVEGSLDRTVSCDFVAQLVRNQRKSFGPAPNSRKFLYIVPEGRNDQLLRDVQALFWPPGLEAEPLDLKPFVLKAKERTVNDILSVGAVGGSQPDLVVAFELSTPRPLAYSWFVDDRQEYGVILPLAQSQELAERVQTVKPDRAVEVHEPARAA